MEQEERWRTRRRWHWWRQHRWPREFTQNGNENISRRGHRHIEVERCPNRLARTSVRRAIAAVLRIVLGVCCRRARMNVNRRGANVAEDDDDRHAHKHPRRHRPEDHRATKKATSSAGCQVSGDLGGQAGRMTGRSEQHAERRLPGGAQVLRTTPHPSRQKYDRTQGRNEEGLQARSPVTPCEIVERPTGFEPATSSLGSLPRATLCVMALTTSSGPQASDLG